MVFKQTVLGVGVVLRSAVFSAVLRSVVFWSAVLWSALVPIGGYSDGDVAVCAGSRRSGR